MGFVCVLLFGDGDLYFRQPFFLGVFVPDAVDVAVTGRIANGVAVLLHIFK